MKTIVSKNRELLILSSSSILSTLFLFFIDEGNYNFNWITEPLVWLIFLMYAVPIFLGQLFISKVILKKYNGTGIIIASILVGTTVGIAFTTGIVFSGFLK
ncbi:hypothetical protein [Aquimarina sp. RZ0]|uniref:hypothetical protein n=1 Tax=Aquimarina sp. RZ0 TaxID=2607730 RepID=UPI0011F30E27|nr:hypothetical protein [Aquimarina sp. RZ0]KAA1243542.1 hypothetical protein F0000_20610 [Aquimarina sp. RZ0]